MKTAKELFEIKFGHSYNQPHSSIQMISFAEEYAAQAPTLDREAVIDMLETYFKEWDGKKFKKPTPLEKQRFEACAEAICSLSLPKLPTENPLWSNGAFNHWFLNSDYKSKDRMKAKIVWNAAIKAILKAMGKEEG